MQKAEERNEFAGLLIRFFALTALYIEVLPEDCRRRNSEGSAILIQTSFDDLTSNDAVYLFRQTALAMSKYTKAGPAHLEAILSIAEPESISLVNYRQKFVLGLAYEVSSYIKYCRRQLRETVLESSQFQPLIDKLELGANLTAEEESAIFAAAPAALMMYANAVAAQFEHTGPVVLINARSLEPILQ